MKAMHVLALTAAVAWLAFLVMGIGGIDGVRSQHVPGYPSEGQVRYYQIPVGVLALIATSWVLGVRWKLRALAIAVAGIALLGMPGYFVFFTGGV
jgi:hypothetical protein